ncbi:MAG: Fur family transcriptional regulator [Thermodesulfobacteriota bacterium]|jgi:Fe2+ or Zn2+ uptake regulation protein|nr:MAG: Fur family transcriptional regulator [Thermodesulfobacteriota bacterium]
MKTSIIKKMKEQGFKITPQRAAIIEVLADETLHHPGANDIYRQARKKTKRLGLSTVYATLNELCRLGIIKMLEFDKKENRYEGNINPHINLICKNCNRILDYNLPVSIDPKEFLKKSRFWVTDTRLEYYGYCRECRKK